MSSVSEPVPPASRQGWLQRKRYAAGVPTIRGVFHTGVCQAGALSLVLSISISISTAASAQSRVLTNDPANRADIQCMALMAAGAGLSEEGSLERLGLSVGMGYYLGRLEARAPSVNWLDRFSDYLLEDFEDEAKAQTERCMAEMTAFASRLTAWGERMEATASKQAGGKPTQP